MYKRNIFFISLITLVWIGVSSCNNTSTTVGAGLITQSQFDVSAIDTLVLTTSTVIYDSLPTSSSFGASNGRLLVGHHNDAKLGSITASAIFQVAPPASLNIDKTQTTYKALSMYLLRDTYHYYDTVPPITMSVFRVTQTINYFSGLRYNKDSVIYDPASPLGTITFTPRPHSKDSVEIFLPDALGEELFALVKAGDPYMTSQANFDKYLNGFILVPDTASTSSFIGFKASPVMRLYYHDLTVLPGKNQEKYLSFAFGYQNLFYNRFQSSRSGTKLATLHGYGDEVNSRNSDNQVYSQAGAGVLLKITPTYIKNMNFIRNNFVATRAIITMKPILGTYDPITPLPPALTGDLVDHLNQSIYPSYISLNLATDLLGSSSYSADITSYINGEIASTANTVNSLIIKIPSSDIGSTVNRIYLGDQYNDFQMKITIFYVTLLEQ